MDSGSSKKIVFMFTLLILHTNNYGQEMPLGRYIGYENMRVFKDTILKDYSVPGIDFKKDLDTTKAFYHSTKWYHEVTIEFISDSYVNIEKVPIIFRNGTKYYPDSRRCILYYDSARILINKRKEFEGRYLIIGSLTKENCKTHRDAIPYYAHCHYVFDFRLKDSLYLKTTFGELLFTKQ
jgi:hypothetical protein